MDKDRQVDGNNIMTVQTVKQYKHMQNKIVINSKGIK